MEQQRHKSFFSELNFYLLFGIAVCEKDEKIGILQDKVRGITRDHVKYILCNAKLAVLSEELTSENKTLKNYIDE